tara:strand:- start:4708 stop:5790 length:1083 start_codon:yes stop_codon:yes gene_type:complete
MIKILTIIGTRPEIIRLSEIIPLLDKYFKQILVHTGQNYDYELDEVFFKNFNLRKPNYFLNANGTFGCQLSTIFVKLEKILLKEKPNSLLVLGDTNSSLSSIIAKRLNIKVYHMEAGNRCYDELVPEEINRKLIDHSSDFLLPYTFRSCENLIKEGIDRKNIFITGNPIYEVLLKHKSKIDKSNIKKRLRLKKNNYFLITLHRQENVDEWNKLNQFIKMFNMTFDEYNIPLIWPIHPRTSKMLKINNYNFSNSKITFIKPLDFFEFVNLEKNAKCVLTDSGTVQEECSIFKVPVVTLRKTTERPETIETGSNFTINDDTKKIKKSIKIACDLKRFIIAPDEYLCKNVSNKIVKILMNNNT